VIGGDYRSLGVVRSLGRRGIPVWLLTDDHWLAASSRYVLVRKHLPAGGQLAHLDFLIRLAEESGLGGWTLIPTTDDGAELAARHHGRLSKHFIVGVPAWKALRWAHDKRLTYALAERAGVDYPWTFAPADESELRIARGRFPVIVKPAYKPSYNALTAAKAWRADDEATLLLAYRAACELVPPHAVLVQEFVSGGGEAHYSYAALAVDGAVLAALTAKRVRQWPMSIGRASTYVETVVEPAVKDAAVRLLAAMRFTGLVEIEFKRDVRGSLKLLDINPRVWGWHSIGPRAGVDFPYLLWRVLHGESVEPVCGTPGVRWMRFSTDLPMALLEIVGGRLLVRDYLEAFRGPLELAIFAADDPLPALCELPLIVQQLIRRRGF